MPRTQDHAQVKMAWSAGPNAEPFNPKMVDGVYSDQLRGKNFDPKRLQAFEISRYLENYLWPNYDPMGSSKVPHDVDCSDDKHEIPRAC